MGHSRLRIRHCSEFYLHSSSFLSHRISPCQCGQISSSVQPFRFQRIAGQLWIQGLFLAGFSIADGRTKMVASSSWEGLGRTNRLITGARETRRTHTAASPRDRGRTLLSAVFSGARPVHGDAQQLDGDVPLHRHRPKRAPSLCNHDINHKTLFASSGEASDSSQRPSYTSGEESPISML